MIPFRLLLIALLLVCCALPGASQGLQSDNSYLLGFRGSANPALVQAAGGEIIRTFHLIPAVAAKLTPAQAAALAANPLVDYLERDGTAYACYESSEVLPWAIERIDAPTVWSGETAGIANTGIGCKVAVLDTGIDYTHPDLTAAHAGGIDLVNGDADPKDDNGHGTACAGLIAAADDGANQAGRNTGYSVVGVAPGCRLYSVKVLNAQAAGAYSTVIAGLEWCKDNGVKVVCLPLGGQLESRALRAACDACWAGRMLLVAAAGNDGGLLSFPARYPSVVAVGAVDEENARTSFSNFGSSLDLMAPGVDVMTTLPTYRVHLTTAYTYRETYDQISGTSMAAALTAGVAALAWARDPAATNVQISRQLCDTATDLGTVGRDPQYGSGLVNAALAAAPR